MIDKPNHGVSEDVATRVIASLGFPADRVARAVALLLNERAGPATAGNNHLMSSRDVQLLLAVSKSTLRRMISRGELTPVQITPRRIGFPADEVSAFVNSLARHDTPFPSRRK